MVRAPRCGPRRPQRGDELIEMRAAQSGLALDQAEAVGREDAGERAVLDVAEPVDRGTIAAQALWFARGEADGQLVGAVAVGARQHDAGRPRTETHEVALVRRPKRPRRAAEVQALEQVRLPRSVGSVDDRQARAECELGRAI